MACANPVEHRPTPYYLETHHIVPLAWVRKGATPKGTVELCGTCHNDGHALYNLMVKHNGVVPWNIRNKFSRYLVRMANVAWENRPRGEIPMTSAHTVTFEK